MFLHNQSRFATELQGDVVPRNTTVLPADPRAVSGMQERFALHVSRWNLFELFSWSKSIREVRYLYQQLCLTAFSFSVQHTFLISIFSFYIEPRSNALMLPQRSTSSAKCVEVLIP